MVVAYMKLGNHAKCVRDSRLAGGSRTPGLVNPCIFLYIGITLDFHVLLLFHYPSYRGLRESPEPSNLGMGGEQTISGKEVAKHNTRQSCWIIVHGKVLLTALQMYPF